MGYHFIGVFISPCDSDLAGLENLFQGYARRIAQPFTGVVLSFFDDNSENSDDEEIVIEDHETIKTRVKAKVLECSKMLEDSTIAYVDYETWGGMPDFCYGFACQNGKLIADSEKEGEDDEGVEVLISLLKIMGVPYSSGYFRPFERGFFPNT